MIYNFYIVLERSYFHSALLFHSTLQKAIQASNAITHGLKSSRRYLWYGVWDIWRRVLFVGANLFISVAPRAGVLVGGCVSSAIVCSR